MSDTPALDAIFESRLKDVRTFADNAADSVRGTGTGTWNIASGWDGNPLIIANMTAAYDRKEIDAKFEAMISDGSAPGKSGNSASLKVQSVYVGMLERSARMRYATPVRLAIMAAARRKGHADIRGVLGESGILGSARRLQVAGSATPEKADVTA